MTFSTPIFTNRQSIDRVLQAGLPVVLVFYRHGSAPARQLEPTLNWLAGDYAGKLLFAKVDIDDEPDLVERFRVTQALELVFHKEGSQAGNVSGVIAEADLRRWCEYLVKGGERPPVAPGPNEATRPQGQASASTAGSAQGGKPVFLTDATFDSAVNADLPVLVDFWAPWCGPCRMIAPAVEALAQEFAGRLVVGKLNVDENPRMAARYGVMSIPTLIVFRNGQAVEHIVGAVPAPVLRQKVLPHIKPG